MASPNTSRWASIVAGACVTLAACSSGSSSEASVEEYCAHMAAYSAATRNVDPSSADSLIASLETSIASARAAADVAPDEVKEASELLAEGGEALLEAIQAENPQSVDQFQSTGSEIAQSLATDELEAATEEALTYAQETCNDG